MNIRVARDGDRTFDFLFCNGPHVDRSFDRPPRLILLI